MTSTRCQHLVRPRHLRWGCAVRVGTACEVCRGVRHSTARQPDAEVNNRVVVRIPGVPLRTAQHGMPCERMRPDGVPCRCAAPFRGGTRHTPAHWHGIRHRPRGLRGPRAPFSTAVSSSRGGSPLPSSGRPPGLHTRTPRASDLNRLTTTRQENPRDHLIPDPRRWHLDHRRHQGSRARPPHALPGRARRRRLPALAHRDGLRHLDRRPVHLTHPVGRLSPSGPRRVEAAMTTPAVRPPPGPPPSRGSHLIVTQAAPRHPA